MDKITGKKLSELLGIDVKHALYGEKGTWYHLLNSFPGALFDKHGYIIFNTEDEYINSEYLSKGKELNISKGIANIPGYIKIVEDGNIQEIIKEIMYEKNKLSNVNIKKPIGNENTIKKKTSTERIIRDTKVSKWIKKLWNNQCQICGTIIDLLNNDTYSEAHHIHPLKNGGPDIIDNLLCVCPNCHVKLDYGAIKIEKDEITIKKEHKINKKYIKYHNENIYRLNHG
jgi:5-methylcytosine-specific restriction protein A